MPSAVETPATPQARPPSWADRAVAAAGHLGRPGFPRGDLAELRRMNPDKATAPAFWRVAAEHGLLEPHHIDRNPDLVAKWALIVHGIALTTPTAGGTAHNPCRSLGTAMHDGPETGGQRRQGGFYSNTRLTRLLAARGPMLHTLLARLFRMLASSGAQFDWRETASWILAEGHDPGRADRARQRVANDYYSAGHRAQPPSDTTNDDNP